MNGLSDYDDVRVTLMSILNGDTLNDIHAMRADIDNKVSQLDSLKRSVQAMPPGAAQQQAESSRLQGEASLAQQFAIYAKLKDNYNEFVRQLQTYSFGAYAPGMAGLGNLGVLPIAAVIEGILAVSALVAILNGIMQLVAAFRGQAVNTQGYISQAADLVKSAGGAVSSTIQSSSNLVSSLGTNLPKILLVVAGGFALFVGIKWYMNRPKKA